MSAADITAVLGIAAALWGGIWSMATDSTRARKAQEKARERERRYYDQRIRDMEEDK